ncbi:MAG: hypothetical protein D3924_07635 [Candidatus Electrothrix sp. AR4]|nr:hypothetical protein [Candidatus Electrothrix sp. AR4]
MSAQKKKTVEPDNRANRSAEQTIDLAALALVSRQARDLLAFHLQLGLSGYPATPELRAVLRNAQQPVSLTKGPQVRSADNRHDQYVKQKHAKPVPGIRQTAHRANGPVPKLTKEAKARQVEMLAKELAACRYCPTAADQTALPGQGSPTARLVVVGDCFIGADSRHGMIWGREEDAMLWRMMEAIGLEQDAVYVTNTLKCPQKDLPQPGTEAEQVCFSYLEKELLAIQPQVICAMGDTATRALLKSKAPLVRLRGRFHLYRYPHGARARVMPTLHPRFLLRHPEMKRAVWEDLQAVQRLLQESASQ